MVVFAHSYKCEVSGENYSLVCLGFTSIQVSPVKPGMSFRTTCLSCFSQNLGVVAVKSFSSSVVKLMGRKRKYRRFLPFSFCKYIFSGK